MDDLYDEFGNYCGPELGEESDDNGFDDDESRPDVYQDFMGKLCLHYIETYSDPFMATECSPSFYLPFITITNN